MSGQTAQLLEAFEALPEERNGFSQRSSCAGQALSILARWVIKRPTRAADELFALLDAEENDTSSR